MAVSGARRWIRPWRRSRSRRRGRRPTAPSPADAFRTCRFGYRPGCARCDPVRQAGLGATSNVTSYIRAPRRETGAGAVAVSFGPEVGHRLVGRSEPDDHVAAGLAFSQTDLIAGSSLSWGALAAGAFRQSSWKTCEGNSCAFPFAGSAPPRVGPGVENQAR